MLEARLTELEIRYTQQQEMLEHFSEVLIAQSKELEHLKAELKRLRVKLAAADDPGLATVDEPPPHY